ncbi:hypothetical protein N7533_011503, partial [Penicillium manginii]|uniref:uncharacterized protein n=1 Tax=Penicillium manginii TaxID=203109 RepID=UPI0025484A97
HVSESKVTYNIYLLKKGGLLYSLEGLYSLPFQAVICLRLYKSIYVRVSLDKDVNRSSERYHIDFVSHQSYSMIDRVFVYLYYSRHLAIEYSIDNRHLSVEYTLDTLFRDRYRS